MGTQSEHRILIKITENFCLRNGTHFIFKSRVQPLFSDICGDHEFLMFKKSQSKHLELKIDTSFLIRVCSNLDNAAIQETKRWSCKYMKIIYIFIYGIQCLSVTETNKVIHWIALPNFCNDRGKKERNLHGCLLVWLFVFLERFCGIY